MNNDFGLYSIKESIVLFFCITLISVSGDNIINVYINLSVLIYLIEKYDLTVELKKEEF